MIDIPRKLGAVAVCGLALVLGGCNDSGNPGTAPSTPVQRPAGEASSAGSVRYQEDAADDATPDADDSDDATPDADDSDDSDDGR